MFTVATPVFAPKHRRAGPLLYLAVCAVVCVAVTVVAGPSSAQATNGETIDNITYTVSGDEATITSTVFLPGTHHPRQWRVSGQ